MTPNTVDALTNEEQVKKIQALERGAAESTRLIENLWVQNCGLVKTIVHNVTGLNAGEPGFDDMEQQSFFGFHAAIYTYDPAADIKFSTYVAKRIKWEICRYYERNGYTIRVPAFMKRRFRECLKKQQQLENTLSRKVSIEAALRELGLSDSIIAGTMAAFHRMKTTSIEAGIECSGEDSDASLLDFLGSDTDMENTGTESQTKDADGWQNADTQGQNGQQGTWQNADTQGQSGQQQTWQNRSTQSPYAMQARKPKRGVGGWALLIIILVFASPMLLGVGGGALGIFIGILATVFALWISFFAVAIGMIGGGIAVLIKGILHAISSPAAGLVSMGGGLICIALGILCAVFFLWFTFQLCPRVLRTTLNFISRIVHKGKEARAE